MTVAQLESELGEDEWLYWRGFEREYGLRDERHHQAEEEEWLRSRLSRLLLFELGGAFVKFRNRAQSIKQFFPETFRERR